MPLLLLLSLTTPTMANPVTVDAVVCPENDGRYTVFWHFDLPDDWHLYGPFQNDSGFPPRIKLKLEDGWELGPLQWPAPVRHVSPGGILDHVYPGDLVLAQTLAGPRDTPLPGLTARLQWLVCRDMCVAGDSTLTVRPSVLPVEWQSTMAGRLSPFPADKIVVERKDSLVTITVPGSSSLSFAPFEGGPLVEELESAGQAEGDVLRLELSNDGGMNKPLTGVLSRHNNTQPVINGIIVIK